MSDQIKVGDELKFDSENGMTYKVVVVNINDFRPPEQKYAIDLYDGNGVYFGDVFMVGQQFIDKCYR